MVTIRKVKIAIGVVAVVLVCLAGVGFKLYRDKLYVGPPDYPPIYKVEWLEQGWSPQQREWFHHTDQGTQTLNIPYEWFLALEQPRISLLGNVGRLSDPAYLDRFGFIPGATKGGEISCRSALRAAVRWAWPTALPGSIRGPTSR